MAEQVKKVKKVREKPAGYESWTPNRKALHRALQYTARMRGLLRSAATNLEDAAIVAATGNMPSGSPELALLDQLVAEARVLLRSLPGAGELLRDIQQCGRESVV